MIRFCIISLAIFSFVINNSNGADDFILPAAFEGLWRGSPSVGVIGPFSPDSFEFAITKAPNGDYLLEDNLLFDGAVIGYQRFYVEGIGKTAGTLWYCGALSNFSNAEEDTGTNSFLPLTFPSASDSTVTFCLDSSSKLVMNPYNPFKEGCLTCDCANWTLSHNAQEDSLSLHVIMSGQSVGSNHLMSYLKRIGPPPVIQDSDMPGHGRDFSCEFDEGGRDSVPVIFPDSIISKHRLLQQQSAGRSSQRANKEVASGCPFLRKRSLTCNNASPAVNSKTKTTASSSSYDYCYSLNAQAGYQLQWSLDTDNQVLHCAVSAPAENKSTYVAIGFRPLSRSVDSTLTEQNTGHHMNFGMAGADIVAGSVDGGIRLLYAEDYTGAPVVSSALTISNATVTYDEKNQRVVLSFTRPVIGGYMLSMYGNNASIVSGQADILWAIGSDLATGSSSDVEIDYHYNTRGMRVIDWENPEIAFAEEWKC